MRILIFVNKNGLGSENRGAVVLKNLYDFTPPQMVFMRAGSHFGRKRFNIQRIQI